MAPSASRSTTGLLVDLSFSVWDLGDRNDRLLCLVDPYGVDTSTVVIGVYTNDVPRPGLRGLLSVVDSMTMSAPTPE
jgi:hypothetical protein